MLTNSSKSEEKEQSLPKTLSMLKTSSLTKDTGLGNADCILYMESRGTISPTGVWDVSLDFWEKKQVLWIILELPD